MKKAILGGLLIAGLLGAGWRYAPPRIREQLLGFIGMASRRDVAEIRRAIGAAVLPEDPTERRKALTQELNRRIRELRRRELVEHRGAKATLSAGITADEGMTGSPTAEVLAGAEQIVKELEGANQDASVGTKITERILERILPAAQCRNK